MAKKATSFIILAVSVLLLNFWFFASVIPDDSKSEIRPDEYKKLSDDPSFPPQKKLITSIPKEGETSMPTKITVTKKEDMGDQGPHVTTKVEEDIPPQNGELPFQRIVRIPSKHRSKMPFRTSKWYHDDNVVDWNKSSTCSKFSTRRDYDEQPIVLLVPTPLEGRKWIDCDIPCISMTSTSEKIMGDAFLERIPAGSSQHPLSRCDGRVKKVIFSMESPVYYPTLEPGIHYDIFATSILNSHVPLLYYSWAEYDFGRRAVPKKDATAMMATFITNCGAKNSRKAYLEELMNDHGITIHSYGGCAIGEVVANDGKGGNWNQRKCELMQSYKFVAALENSNYPDYVTEKLFGPLAVGTIPIHMGDPNVHSLAPNNHSVISVHDFKDPKHLASYLKYLDSNDSAYRSYFTWKKEGYSRNFKSKIDHAIVHSICRLCIAVGDRHRWEIGPAKHEFSASTLTRQDVPQGVDFAFLARVRGTFWFEKVFVQFDEADTYLTFRTLFRTLEKHFCDEKHQLVEIVVNTVPPPRPPLKNDDDVKSLELWTELELLVIKWPEDPEDYAPRSTMGYCS